MTTTITDPVEAAAELKRRVEKAGSMVFFGGAGVSTASGIPDFRSPNGLYNQRGYSYPPETMLSHSFYRSHTEEFFDFYRHVMCVPDAKPNRCHYKLAELEAAGKLTAVVTQNIDGLHLKAGSSSVIEIHGTLEERFCPHCGTEANASDCQVPPRCRNCGGIVRPTVVLFGEQLPGAAIERLYDELETGFDMVFVIGTTAVFPYIAEPVLQAVRAGIPTVEINPAHTRLSDQVKYHVPARAATALSEIIRFMPAATASSGTAGKLDGGKR